MPSWPAIFFGSLAFAALAGVFFADCAFCLTSQDVPAAELSSGTGGPGATVSTPAPSAAPSPNGWEALPTTNDSTQEPASGTAAQDDTSGENSPSSSDGSPGLGTQQTTVTSNSPPASEVSPPPALDAGALRLTPDLGTESLDPQINKAVAPALAASLRITESARKRLADGDADGAMRELARAVSLDPSNAFAYYYLGRANLLRKNYTQALIFFRRAEIGFNGRPDWTAEALSYEGICDEEMGKPTDAAEAYKRALSASPNNFKARVGYGRLASVTGPVESIDAPPPNQDLAMPAPGGQNASPPSEQAPAPPPE
jgi:TolA-binding protein